MVIRAHGHAFAREARLVADRRALDDGGVAGQDPAAPEHDDVAGDEVRRWDGHALAADDVDVADGFRQLRDRPLVRARDGDVERRGRDDHGAEEAADDEVGEPEPDEVGRQLVQIVNADELVREALEPRVDAEGDGVGPAVDEPVRGLRRRQTAALEERVEALEARGHVDARPLEAGPVEDVARRLDDDVLAARGGTGEVVLAGPGDALVGPLEGELEPHA